MNLDDFKTHSRWRGGNSYTTVAEAYALRPCGCCPVQLVLDPHDFPRLEHLLSRKGRCRITEASGAKHTIDPKAGIHSSISALGDQLRKLRGSQDPNHLNEISYHRLEGGIHYSDYPNHMKDLAIQTLTSLRSAGLPHPHLDAHSDWCLNLYWHDYKNGVCLQVALEDDGDVTLDAQELRYERLPLCDAFTLEELPEFVKLFSKEFEQIQKDRACICSPPTV